MTRDGGVIIFQRRRYTDRCFSPQRAREWIPRGLLVSTICSFTYIICCHAVRAVYVCVCCWVLPNVD